MKRAIAAALIAALAIFFVLSKEPKKIAANPEASSSTFPTPVPIEPTGIQNKQPVPKASASTEPYPELSQALGRNLATAGFSQELADCIMGEAHQNLTREKPLDFNGLTDSCAKTHNLSTPQKIELRKVFRQSVKDTDRLIDVETWNAWMLEKYKQKSCLNDIIRGAVEALYAEKSAIAPEAIQDFQNSWIASTDRIVNEAAQKCPNDLEALDGVLSNECTVALKDAP